MESIDKIAKKCGVHIKSNEDRLLIQSRFTLRNKSVSGFLILVILGVSLMISCFFVNGAGIGAKIYLMILGLLIFAIGAVSVVIQTTNFIELKGNTLTYRYVLRTTRIVLSKEDNVKMESKMKHVKRLRNQYGQDSYFRVVTIVLNTREGRPDIFDFQLDEDHAREAKYFGKEIERIINQRINLI
jgi:hypothetical protein